MDLKSEYDRMVTSPPFATMPPSARHFLEKCRRETLSIDPGSDLLTQGQADPNYYTIISGVAQTSMESPAGSTLLGLLFPGDLAGLQYVSDDPMCYSVTALTRLEVLSLPRSALPQLAALVPDYVQKLSWLSALELNIMARLGTNAGHGRGPDRLAATLYYIFRRAEAANLTDGNTMRLPIKQSDLAAALGISLVHTNKSLRKLREQDLIHWRNSALEVLDRKGLEDLVQDVPDYIFSGRPIV
ncbi:Crp/Fnr family transcriptional regulator [Paracoccaceae bacterium GXU_MW_L88]